MSTKKNLDYGGPTPRYDNYSCLSVSEDFSFQVGLFCKLFQIDLLLDDLIDWDLTLQTLLEWCKLVHDVPKTQNILCLGTLAIQTPDVFNI